MDRTVGRADPAGYDGLLVPGGFINPDLLRQSAQARAFVRGFAATGRPLVTLCHGPWVLASAGLLQGRTLTSWPGIRDDVVNAGGTWLDRPVVRDGSLTTSRGPQDLALFVPAMLDAFAGPGRGTGHGAAGRAARRAARHTAQDTARDTARDKARDTARHTARATAADPRPAPPGSDPQREQPPGLAAAALRRAPKPSLAAVVGVALAGVAVRARRAGAGGPAARGGGG
ncbi:DJ-1/PfpI family protein [Cellulomonas marina]|uniref:Protease I n=1 Tax=Cellulomonas marina TaxID=988821 RepID=A0A1I0XYS2_9CELL|nr:DJ-1/PfpI family protein [Cellulomonas marina]GIG28445.1 hypothetical protein Cma02nite_10450 [Cellulomonas marina]SFB06165.1 protease I [Cellulomonas marina]